MAEVLRLLFEEFISVDLVEKWLNDEDIGNNEHLVKYDKCRAVFVSHLLNFIRNECSWILQKSPHVGSCSGSSSHAIDENQTNRPRPTPTVQTNQDSYVDSPNPLESGVPSLCFYKMFKYDNRKSAKKKGKNPRNTARQKIVPINQEPIPDFNDMEAFPPIGAAPVRRITPTPASAKSVVFSPGSSAWRSPQAKDIFALTPLVDNNDSSLTKERQLLKEAKKQPEFFAKEMPATCDSSNKSSTADSTERASVIPKKSEVTEETKLNILADLYVICLVSNLVPNLSVELYFIVQLLTAQVKQSNQLVQIFSSVHNCAYFATGVLEKNAHFLGLLDQSALKLMTGLPYLKEFSSNLLQKIVFMHTGSSSPASAFRMSSIQSVAYQEDVDNRTNFPTDESFRVFCRQRDVFYELLRDWQSHRSNPTKFARQVQLIVSLGLGPTNFSHLARLLLSQMISMCCTGETPQTGVAAEMAIEELKQNSVEKLDKLKQRMLTPSHAGSPCPPPSFSGYEEFFHEFLLIADSASLNQHLVDQLKSKIQDLNAVEVLVNDAESGIDTYTRQQFISTLLTVRFLGKFLGFLVFLPYQDKISTNGGRFSSSESRSLNLPLDLHNLLEEAKNNGRLLLTVPWIVEYLSMMDSVAPSMDYYRDLLSELIRVYRNSNQWISNKNACKFLQLTLGRLFEMPAFPQSVFFLTSAESRSEITCTANGYDQLDLIEQSHVYSFVPYIAEIRVLLKDYFGGIRRGGKEVRKITPVSVDDSHDADQSSAKKLQQDLEDNFFHLHPSSTKRTVEFVADRTSSKAIKQIKQTLIPELIKKAVQKLELEGSRQELYSAAYELYHSIKNASVSFAKEYCDGISSQAIVLLLPEETANDVVKTCGQITCRISVDKVVAWMKSVFNIDYLNMELSSQLKNKKIESFDRFTGVNPLVANPMLDLLDDITESHQGLYSGDPVTADRVKNLLVSLGEFIRSDFKMFSFMIKSLKVLTLDWAVAIIVHKPSQMDEDVLKAFVQMWYEDLDDKSIGLTLLSPRNVQLLSMSSHPIESWQKFEELLGEVSRHVESPTRMISNGLAITNQNWPSGVLARFNNLLEGLFAKCDCNAADQQYAKLNKWAKCFSRQM